MSRLLCLLLLIPASYAVLSSLRRPCHFTDHRCIGSYLAVNSVCNPSVRGAIPSNYTIPKFYVETAGFNSTFYDINLSISNHNKCAVSEFLFNDASNCAVIAIRCKGLIFQSTRKMYQHYPEREDVLYDFNYNGTYPEVIVTVSLCPSGAINLCNSQAYAHVSALPNFRINPNDKATDDFLTRDLTLLYIHERETFLYRANELIRYYINSMICNFGCDF